MSTPSTLPQATCVGRWQPIRCGLLNLYRFDDEVFVFEQGRLILRGNNGTGKSRVMALTLPFLLDGDVAPYRVEPDCDPAKRMEWNLLMGRYPERLGYTWIEFGIMRADGIEEYVTLGCGLKAAEGRGLLGHWFFVTKQRVGKDLFLAEDGRPHSKARLEQAVGDRGNIFVKSSEYRAAVDAKLFGLGSRYSSLINLLIQLRQPQLSRKLDETLLSSALSEALPPLSEKLLGDIAEAFRGLENERVELDNLTAADRGIERFLRDYRRYVQIAARQRAARLLTAQTDHSRVVRGKKQHEADKRKAEEALANVAIELSQLVNHEAEIKAKIEALKEGPEMRSAKNLEASRKEAEDASNAVTSSEEELRVAVGRVEKSDAELIDLSTGVQSTAFNAKKAITDAESGAARAGLDEVHQKGVKWIDLDTLTDNALVATAEAQLNKETQGRLKNIAYLEPLEKAVEKAESALQQAKLSQAQIETRLAAATERHMEKHRALEMATETILARYRSWASALVELHPRQADEMDESFPTWVETGEGESPLSTAVRCAWEDFQRAWVESEGGVKQREKENREELESLRLQKIELLTGRHQPPAPPTTRAPNIREGQPGAPLWAICDFRESLSIGDRAQLEAALESSGLLDAWVMPDGRLLGADEFDTVFVPGISPRAPEGRTLAEVLQPEPGAAIGADTIASVLQHIGFGEGNGNTWVDLVGQWQVGPLRGAWSKPTPQHIGASAREIERQRRIAENERQTALALEAKQLIDDELTVLDSRMRTAHAECDAVPKDAPVQQAIAEEKSERQNVALHREEAIKAEMMTGEKRTAFNGAVEKRDTDARDLGLGEWTGRLPILKEAVLRYQADLARLFGGLGQLITARQQLHASERRLEELRQDFLNKQDSLARVKTQHAMLDARCKTLHATVGATVQELYETIALLGHESEEVEKQQKIQTHCQNEASTKIAVAESILKQAEEELVGADAIQTSAVTALSDFAKTRLLGVAHDEFRNADSLDWSTRGAVEIANRIELLLKDVASADADWKRNQGNMYSQIEELKNTLLHHGFSPQPTTTEDGIFVVNVPYGGRSLTMAEMREALLAEIGTRKMLLSAKEREVMENYLIDEAASELHIRIREAQDWVRKANDELARRPMGSGMSLRFDWEPRQDGPAGLADARKQLLRLSSTWSPSERKALGNFLEAQIEDVRQNNEAGTWQQHLSEALDYRRWHLFSVSQKRDRGEDWKRLTKRTHGTGSGGEKAIALTMPQFAAAAAYYTSIPTAPRLILLDEAFAGVDGDMRRQCMGLLTSFDLDFMMTSESEWGCHPTVPAVAIYHVARRDGIDAIGITRWVWNGTRRVMDSSNPTPASAPEPRPASAEQFHLDES